MTIYKINGETYIVHGGRIFSELPAAVSSETTLKNMTLDETTTFSALKDIKIVGLPKKRGRKVGSKYPTDGGLTAIRKRAKSQAERRKHLGPEAEEVIRQDIVENDLTLTVACKKYSIAVSTYYRLKNNGPVKETHGI